MLANQKDDFQGGRGDDTDKQSDGDDKKRKREKSVPEDGKQENPSLHPGIKKTKTEDTPVSTGQTQSPEQGDKKQPKKVEVFANAQKKYELSKMANLANVAKIIEGQEPVTKSLIPEHIEPGVLIPLKTTLELRDDHRCGHILITRSPIRSTSAVINLLRDMLPEEVVKGMPHLRRCAKPSDLPAHLKTEFMNKNAQTKQIHTGKSNWVYVMLGLEATLSRTEMTEALSKLEGFEDGVFLASIPVPLLAPTSQIQAALWTSQFWPTMYRKNNPLGPHPSMVVRATEEIADDAPIWMSLAHDMAVKSKESGNGEALGACIVYRGEDGPRLVAVAGDARWCHQPKSSKTGNPMAHAVLRAVSMVAQKLVRAEKKGQRRRSTASLNSENSRPGSAGNASATPVNDSKTGDTNGAGAAAGEGNEDGATSANGEDDTACQVHNEVQDRVRDRLSRNRDRGHAGHRQRLAFEVFQDKPLMEEEERVFAEEHPTPDGYLCHGLELYVTHEPCGMCSMAILHSRMGKVVFAKRMPLTGGLSAEDRVFSASPTPNLSAHSLKSTRDQKELQDIPSGEGIHGLGLFWRRELNWSMLAWEWEAHCSCKPLEMDPTTHA